MNNISLLPQEIKKKLRTEKKISVIAMICLVLCIALAFTYFIMNAFINIPTQEYEYLISSNLKLSQEVDALNEYEDLENSINKNIEIRDILKDKRPELDLLYFDIMRAIPNGVIMDKMVATLDMADDKTSIIIISGSSITTEEIIDFSYNLREIDLLDDVQIVYQSKNIDEYSFEIRSVIEDK